MHDRDPLLRLLEAVARGDIDPTLALEQVRGFTPVGEFARLDRTRSQRTGFPEAIYAAGKTPEQFVQIATAIARRGEFGLATRVSAAMWEQVCHALPEWRYFATARVACWGDPLPSQPGAIAVLAAGTSDIPVAEEAAVTAELCGFAVKRLWDVGVAGIHRLFGHRHLLDEADVAIVVAGMEGALASVVGGLVDCPIVAVPTSVGYGAHFQGLAALLTMLNSCAAGVGVVNIDNGFGAAILAGQILRLAAKKASLSNPPAELT